MLSVMSELVLGLGLVPISTVLMRVSVVDAEALLELSRKQGMVC